MRRSACHATPPAHRRYNINVLGYHFMVRTFLPLLQAAPTDFERTIINITSAGGWFHKPLASAMGALGYRVTKAAENALTVGLQTMYGAEDDGAKGIRGGPDPALRIARIVSVHPGPVLTGLGNETLHATMGTSTDEELAAAKATMVPMLTPAEGADSAIWAAAAADGAVPPGGNVFKRASVPW